MRKNTPGKTIEANQEIGIFCNGDSLEFTPLEALQVFESLKAMMDTLIVKVTRCADATILLKYMDCRVEAIRK